MACKKVFFYSAGAMELARGDGHEGLARVAAEAAVEAAALLALGPRGPRHHVASLPGGSVRAPVELQRASSASAPVTRASSGPPMGVWDVAGTGTSSSSGAASVSTQALKPPGDFTFPWFGVDIGRTLVKLIYLESKRHHC